MDIDKYVENSCRVSLMQMLEAREKRAERQASLIDIYDKTLISFTMNIPGEYKSYPLCAYAFQKGFGLIEDILSMNHIEQHYSKKYLLPTGPEGYFIVDAEPETVKQLTCDIEDAHPAGRLFDIDVISNAGKKVSRSGEGETTRECIIGGKPVWECSRSRNHSALDLSRRTAELLLDYYIESICDEVSSLAVRSLLYEVSVTPKPGLVDLKNNGSHSDMDVLTFIDSSSSLYTYFKSITLKAFKYKGPPEKMLPEFRFLGQLAEARMLRATGGINTHKGAIFSLGLICMAFGILKRDNAMVSIEKVLSTCGKITSGITNELDESKHDKSHGERAYKTHGIKGVRGEADAGFPSVVSIAVPVFNLYHEKGLNYNDTGVITLMHLISKVDDTNIVARSGAQILEDIHKELSAFLNGSPAYKDIIKKAHELDDIFISENISPGGCADLLAMAFFLHFLLKSGL